MTTRIRALDYRYMQLSLEVTVAAGGSNSAKDARRGVSLPPPLYAAGTYLYLTHHSPHLTSLLSTSPPPNPQKTYPPDDTYAMASTDLSWVDSAFPLPSQQKLNASVRAAIGNNLPHHHLLHTSLLTQHAVQPKTPNPPASSLTSAHISRASATIRTLRSR